MILHIDIDRYMIKGEAKDTLIQDYIRIGAVYESYVSFMFLQELIESCNLSKF